jgi:hypothetical protein
MTFPQLGRLLEGVGKLQHAEIILVPAGNKLRRSSCFSPRDFRRF